MILTKMRNCRFLLPLVKFAKVMFLHLSVILFTGGGGGRAASGVGLGRPSPPIGYYGIRSTSGRYASYRNAFLFLKKGIVFVVESLKKSANLCPSMLLDEIEVVRFKHRSTKFLDKLSEFIKTLPKED